LRVHVDLPAGVADLLNHAGFNAFGSLLALPCLEATSRERRFFGALTKRVGDTYTDNPSGIVSREELVETVAERRDGARPNHGARESSGHIAQDLGPPESTGLVGRVHPHVWQTLVSGKLHRHACVIDILMSAVQVGAVAEGIRHGRIQVDGRGADRW